MIWRIMSLILLKFLANFVAIIVLAVAIDSEKDVLASYVGGQEEEIEPESITNGIRTMNTISLSFVAAINAYAFTERSLHLLTVVGIAYLTNMVVFLILSNWKRQPLS